MLKLFNLFKSLASNKNKNKNMNWNILNSIDQLSEIDEKSKTKTQILFKHSTRCSVSSFAKKILESEYNDDVEAKADVYYLDLIAFRDISNGMVSRYNVEHQSPQLLVIKDGVSVFNSSHSDVSFEKALSSL
jgi:bacillithiol system protein YtxJ